MDEHYPLVDGIQKTERRVIMLANHLGFGEIVGKFMSTFEEGGRELFRKSYEMEESQMDEAIETLKVLMADYIEAGRETVEDETVDH